VIKPVGHKLNCGERVEGSGLGESLFVGGGFVMLGQKPSCANH
jgi:hypothetical protein